MNKKLHYLLIASVLSASQIASSQTQYTVSGIQNTHGESITDWITNSQGFSIKLGSSSTNTQSMVQTSVPDDEQFQVLIGDHDVSSLFKFERQSLIFAGGIPLPAGENELMVNQYKAGEWQAIGSLNIQVMTRSGFKQAQWTPKLELNINSQRYERVSGDGTASERPTYADVSANIGLASHHENNSYVIDSNINLLAVSNRQQAIQFSDKGNQARKIDVVDYQVSVNKGNNKVSFGQVSYGNNALLVDNLSRRGVVWNYQNEAESSLSGAILNGTDIVGFNNFSGLADITEQYVKVLGFGFNTLTDSRVSLRLEGNYLDAQRTSASDFGVGEVRSAEKNQAIGFKLTANDSEGKLNAELTLGMSRYNNPIDNTLDFGEELVALKSKTAVAHNFTFSYILLQDWQTPWDSVVSFTINANMAKTAPLYQTLTAFVQANVETKLVGAQYQLGSVSGSLSSQSSQDNLDNLVNILTTKTINNSFNSNIPLAKFFLGTETTSVLSSWLPGVDYSYQSTHQYAINSPDSAQSGFNGGSHLPDQQTTSHSLAANWQLAVNSISLSSNYSLQDNKQIGRENADFNSLQHALSFNLQQDDQTSWIFSISRNRQNDFENKIIKFSNSITVGFNWQSQNGLALSANYGLTKDDDSLKQSENTATNADIGLVQNLTKGEWWFPADGSLSLRINYNDGKSIDRTFALQNKFSTTTALLGISLSFQ